MDEKSAIAEILAAYEKLIGGNKRVKALEKKLAEGTITLREAAELNDIRSRAFGRAFSGAVLRIAQDEREGTCTALLREGCNDVDELAREAQRAVLARQGLNLTPPTASFEEERARKIGHSLEDETVPDETIERRARSATENMLRSQYDRNMKKGAETCASAGLKTYIIRDSGSGCCKWCDEVSGKFVYGTEPKDVYRRHDNCTCTVVYESGRGRQNVWSKQYWSQEQEKEYLRLRDEMAPKRLNAKQAQALRERVGGLTFGTQNGIIIPKPRLNISMQYFAKGHREYHFPDTPEGRSEKAKVYSEIMTWYHHRYEDQPLFTFELSTENGYIRYKVLNKGSPNDCIILSRRKSKK